MLPSPQINIKRRDSVASHSVMPPDTNCNRYVPCCPNNPVGGTNTLCHFFSVGSLVFIVRRKNYPAHYELQVAKCNYQRSGVENFMISC
jgi:hypothetical protein